MKNRPNWTSGVPSAGFAPRLGIIAGLAGGLAEIIWIALYASLSATEAAAVARGVTGTVWPSLAASTWAVPLGIALHMAIAMVLGIAVATLMRPLYRRSRYGALGALATVAALVAVWAVNFLVLLPAINPAFVALLPYGASLASKVLFGLAAAAVLWGASRSRTGLAPSLPA